MSLYESVFIAKQDLSASAAEKLAADFAKIIENNSGKVAKQENWGLRSLAYNIKKNNKGHYFLFNIDAPFDAVKEYERTMGINEDILRFLTIKVEEFEQGPSIMIKAEQNDNDEVFDVSLNEEGDK